MRVTDLEGWLFGHGWQPDGIRGSHRWYRHKPSDQRICLAVHGGDGRSIEPSVLRAFMKRLHRLDVSA